MESGAILFFCPLNGHILTFTEATSIHLCLHSEWSSHSTVRVLPCARNNDDPEQKALGKYIVCDVISHTDSDKQLSEHKEAPPPPLSDKETMTVTVRLYRQTPTHCTACNQTWPSAPVNSPVYWGDPVGWNKMWHPALTMTLNHWAFSFSFFFILYSHWWKTPTNITSNI
jgi:hypothetical protein